MKDISFDISQRDIELKRGDFVFSENISAQNAGIVLESKNSFLVAPIFGVGIGGSLNSDMLVLSNLLAKWKQQVLTDGAVTANYKADNINGLVNLEINATYL